MEPVKEIKQLRRKEELLENINELQLKNLKRRAGSPMLVMSLITGALGLFVLLSMLPRKG